MATGVSNNNWCNQLDVSPENSGSNPNGNSNGSTMIKCRIFGDRIFRQAQIAFNKYGYFMVSNLCLCCWILGMIKNDCILRKMKPSTIFLESISSENMIFLGTWHMSMAQIICGIPSKHL